jgi:hypothetical protein
MPSFKASVQYGDWHGTAAADDIDPGARSGRRYLEEKGLVKDNEFVVAIEFFIGEAHHNEKLPKPYIRAFVLEGVHKYEEAQKRLEELQAAREAVPVREISVDIPLEEFLGMFKRFSVMLTWQDLPLTDREYRVIEED